MIRGLLAKLFRNQPVANDLKSRQAQQWSRLGQKAPYWSVLSGCSKTQTVSEADQKEFYRSGGDEIETMREFFHSVGQTIPSGRCLDWGCGLGRVLVHLAPLFDEAVGVDISHPHLQITRTYADSLEPHIAQRIVLYQAIDDEAAIKSLFGQVDLVHSILVLQHMPPPLMIETLTTFAQLLKKGGYAFFQIPTQGDNYDFRNFNMNHRGDFDMHALPPGEIQAIFNQYGCRQLAMIERDRTGPGFASHYFIFHKTA
jgi:2-polyprenyl-3-methyl-5-hydroxy-6-metoxy-1,4-benzoquinol methylase